MTVNNDLYKTLSLYQIGNRNGRKKILIYGRIYPVKKTQMPGKDDVLQSADTTVEEDKDSTNEVPEDVQAKVRGVHFDTCLQKSTPYCTR